MSLLSGHPVNSMAWFESEKALLFDYMVRMSGEPEKIPSILLDVMQAVQEKVREQGWGLEQARLELYKTARSFAADRWFVKPEKELDKLYEGTNHHDALRQVENFTLSLDPKQRELVLLRFRYGFSQDDLSKLVPKAGEGQILQVSDAVQAFLDLHEGLSTRSFLQLPLFELEQNDHTTIALSALFEAEDEAKFSWLKLCFFLLLLGAGGLIYIYYMEPELMSHLPF